MPAVRYFVSDVERAIGFYSLLGFEVRERYGPPIAILEKDGQQLWLSGPTSSAGRPMPDGRVPEVGGWNRIVVELDDVPAAFERLKASGVAFRNEPLTGPGGTQVLAEDPDGNPVELFQPR